MKQKCACRSSFVRLFGSHFHRDEYIPHQELGHQAVLFAEFIREQRDAEAEKLLK